MRPSRVTRPPRGTRLETRPAVVALDPVMQQKGKHKMEIARVLPSHRKSHSILTN